MGEEEVLENGLESLAVAGEGVALLGRLVPRHQEPDLREGRRAWRVWLGVAGVGGIGPLAVA